VFKDIWNGIKDFFKNIWGAISSFFKGDWDVMMAYAINAFLDLAKMISKVVVRLGAFIADTLIWALNAVIDLLTDTILGGILSLLAAGAKLLGLGGVARGLEKAKTALSGININYSAQDNMGGLLTGIDTFFNSMYQQTPSSSTTTTTNVTNVTLNNPTDDEKTLLEKSRYSLSSFGVSGTW